MTEETTQQFLARLWQLQAEQGLTNSEIARRLGISPSYVRRLKTRGARVRSIGYQIALRAVEAFPELALFLTSDLPISKDILPTCKDEGGGEQQ